MGALKPNPGPLNVIKWVIPTLATTHKISKAQDSKIKGQKSIQDSL